MCRKFKKLTKFKKILFLTALVLLLFFVLHAVEFNHEHAYEIFGSDQVKAVLHAGDKKWWFLLTWMALVFTFAYFARRYLIERSERKRQFSSSSALYLFFDFTKLFDSLRAAFRQGTLHSKICE